EVLVLGVGSMKKQSVILPKEESAERVRRLSKLANFMGQLDLKRPWEIVVQPYRRERTNQQNRYLRGVCATLLAEHTGYEVDEVYEYLLGSYFGWKQVRCPKTPSNPKGIEDKPIRTTTTDES